MNNPGITVAPGFFTLTITTNNQVELTSYIKNPSSQPIKLNITKSDFNIADSLLGQINTNLNNEQAPSNWLTLPFETIEVAPNSTAEYKFSLKIPENGKINNFYPMLSFKRAETTNGVLGINAEIVTPFYLNILKQDAAININNAISILDFRTEYNFVIFPQNTFNIKFQNLGEFYAYPKGKIEIYNSSGIRLLETPTINDDFEILLKNESRDLQIKWEPPFVLKIIPDFGEYRAVAQIYTSTDLTNPTTVETTFYVIPAIHIGISLIIVLVIGLMYSFVKRLKKIAIKK